MKRLLLVLAIFLGGCAVRSSTNPQAKDLHPHPQWVPSIPAGGHWDCGNPHYQYNVDTDRCELNPE